MIKNNKDNNNNCSSGNECACHNDSGIKNTDNHYKWVLRAVPGSSLIVQDNLIKASNHHFTELCGLTTEEINEKSIDSLIRVPDIQKLETLTKTGDTTEFTRAEILQKGEHSIPVHIHAGRISYGKKPAALLFIKNMSDQMKTEDELQEAGKLESIAALSGGIAHDYNNLLTVIIGNISLVQSYVDSDDIIFRLLNEAYEASMIAKALTQKLITFSKGGAPIKETASISTVAKNAAEFSLSGSNIKFKFKEGKGLFLVEIDKTQIGQAIHNIVMNGREAMPDGGTIFLSADNHILTEDSELLPKGKYVRLAIQDQGSGIQTENIKKVFDPYFSTKQRGTQKGMGLGLSICHSIIKKHGGGINVESEMGMGTTVYIYFPASDKTRIEKIKAGKVAPKKRIIGNGKILLMDDEEMIINLAKLMLKNLGYDMAFAMHGSEALEKYKNEMEKGTPFDAVILDLTVRGGMGGKETIKKLKKIDGKVKALVSSGYSDDPVLTNFKKYGFNGVIVKPYSLYELGESLSEVLME